MNSYNQILADLQQTEPFYPTILSPFYQHNDTALQQVKTLLRQLRRAKSLRNRVEIIVVLWHMGKVIETKTESLTERTQCMNLLSPYYRKVVVRVYYLYELIGIDQIARTKHTTIGMLSRINCEQHQQLVQEASTIAGARMLEEEVVSDDPFASLNDCAN